MTRTTTIRRNRKYSEAQNLYLLAKAAYETARDAANAKIEALDDSDEEAYFVAIDAIESEIGVYDLGEVLSDAENALIDWAIDKVKTDCKTKAKAFGNQAGIDLDDLAKKSKYLYNIRLQMVEISMKLAA